VTLAVVFLANPSACHDFAAVLSHFSAKTDMLLSNQFSDLLDFDHTSRQACWGARMRGVKACYVWRS
jgi:hypothetical protein